MASVPGDIKLDVCCLTEYRPIPGTPNGEIIKIAGINSYYIQGKDAASKGKTIVLLTDIFGLTKNPCMTADELSEKSGFDVYVPDILNGDPVPSSFLKNLPKALGEKPTFGTKIIRKAKFVATLGPWILRHRQAVVLPIIENFIKVLRTEREVTRIQTVGYCFGGYYTLLLGNDQLHLVDAAVGCHISMVTKSQFEEIKVPVGIVCAEEDDVFSDALRQEAETILAGRPELPSKFYQTEGTVHGFASRPDPDNPISMKGYKQANDFIIEWAKTYL